MKKYLIVNATALDKSGALSILVQFVENIPVDDRKWLIFISPAILVKSTKPNVRIEPVKGVKSLHKRLWWDAMGLKKWLKENEIEPVAMVSLQNTGFRVGKKVPSFIYYHQPIPFYPNKWNPLKTNERTFWFYRNIYPFFVNLFLKKDTKVFVQLEFIRDGFAKRFNHHRELIKVYSPSVSVPQSSKDSLIGTSAIKTLLYPAMPYFYKNHEVIESALKLTETDVEVLFTIDQDNRDNINDKRLKFIGMQPYDFICALYRTCDALLFPSYVETFGLPLLEAALTGMPILAADLPYAREVLKNYDGVTYLPFNKPCAWAKAIDNIGKGKRYKPIDISLRPSWAELFENIK